MAFNLSNDQIELEAELKNHTNEFKRDFTDPNDIEDENEDTSEDENENEYDMDAVKKVLEELRNKFSTIKAVRPSCKEVELLLTLTDHNSWGDFQKQFKEELNEYFETVLTELPEVNKEMLIQAENRRDAVKTKIIALETSIKAHQKAVTQFQSKANEAEMELLATEGMEWDPEYKKRNLAANKMLLNCKHQLKLLESKDPNKELKQAYTLLRFRNGAVRFAEKAIHGEFRVLVNTGRTKEDARIYQKIADSTVWEINRLLDKESEAEQRMATERYSGDMSVARQSFIKMNDTSGGVYESAVEQLHRIRDDMEEAFATYNACIHGYELAAIAFVPTYDREWFPEIPELNVALRQARQRAHQATINKAKSQMEAARELLKR